MQQKLASIDLPNKLAIPEREHDVCPPAGVQLQLLNTNRTVRVTHDIEVKTETGAPYASPPSINHCSPTQTIVNVNNILLKNR